MTTQVIKADDVFLLTDERGDIPAGAPGGLGLFTRDTRFLSRFELRLNGSPLLALTAEAERGDTGRVLLVNAPAATGGPQGLARDSVVLERLRIVADGVLYERLTVTNHHRAPQEVEVAYEVDADFADVFLVRGYPARRRGLITARRIDARGLRVRYDGADGIRRETRIRFSEPAATWDQPGRFRFRMALQPGEHRTLTLTVEPVIGADRGDVAGGGKAKGHRNRCGPDAPAAARREPVRSLEQALAAAEDAYRRWQEALPRVESSHPLFDRLVRRGLDDLRMLTIDLGDGPLPVAGIPWFAAPFGRDSLIAALQALPFLPELARGTLRSLARLQGQRVDVARSEEPGKIPHEIRFGELANTGQVPFGRYYGSVDATPLFLIVAAEFYRWTGDRTLVEGLWPHVDAALRWIEHHGDVDGDGFVEYRGDGTGLINQGWKDSGDAVVHRDGTLARGPIALCEVQGYVYEALRQWGRILREWGEAERAAQLQTAAQRLRERFNQAFWMDDEEFVALALDGDKRQVAVITSNAGHLLITDLLGHERAARVARRLLEPDLFSGYGIRTMSSRERAYNPASYHNGSVWPHDNSLIAWGMARQGYGEGVHRILAGLLAVAEQATSHRLPELWCGFSAAAGPFVPYPAACAPQAWAAGAPLLLVRALLGLEPDAPAGVIRLQPVLPPWLAGVRLRGLRVGGGRLSLEVRRRTAEDGKAGSASAERRGVGPGRSDEEPLVAILENDTGLRVVVDR
ncbi:amylo-alpha-1,6-glucosidase [Thermaerobacter sp. FW80]|uniref:amylo-alpha-1,6-glucosidase n=1 Tax=Thermaerobacter sp. FW80 TaxID=2546351 RepID=UPI0010757AE3|nr:glycogen debranching N-terminal domain-containing protein [Thermaerobacter sp. FW80]QBS37265.1 amylo-alpha-1,6-glucosidase [Thermaerobacter sp. FW80]